jgi:ABC-type multidrug transport system ATPase subunit
LLPDGRSLLFEVGDTRLSALADRGSRLFGDIWTTALNVIRRTPSESDAVDSIWEMVYLWRYWRRRDLIVNAVGAALFPRMNYMTRELLAAQAISPLFRENAERPLVQIVDATKSFGQKLALDRISFSVPGGRICGLLGPNGAGKTTLFRLLMGILKATDGRLLVDGLDAFEDRVEVKRRIGFLPDEPVFYSYLSGRETLELSAAMHGLDVAEAMARLAPMIERLRLSDEIDGYAEDYSRGMKKKLGLLLAILHRPKLLVLDEPTNGLDVETTHFFYDLIFDLANDGVTILFSTHLMEHVLKLCSHAVILDRGRLVFEGSLAQLRDEHGGEGLEEIFLALTRRAAEQ